MFEELRSFKQEEIDDFAIWSLYGRYLVYSSDNGNFVVTI